MVEQKRIVTENPIPSQHGRIEEKSEYPDRIYDLDTIPLDYVLVLGESRTTQGFNEHPRVLEHGYNIYGGTVRPAANEHDSSDYLPLLLKQSVLHEMYSEFGEFPVFDSLEDLQCHFGQH